MEPGTGAGVRLMSSTLPTILLWIAALSSGLMAGVYFAFSGFIMRAFGNIEASHAVAAMNSINETILRSMFMPLFFGSTIVSVLLVIVAIINRDDSGAIPALIAGTVYFVGMFVCTIVFNVPLNNLLAGQEPEADKTQQIWSQYRRNWITWNHLRTVASLVTFVLSILLLTK